jgi:predicted O-methyltransferase YrrM
LFSKIFSYLKFVFKSKNQHGIHSPFVYDLVTKCLYKRLDYNKLSTHIQYRKELNNSNSIIEITDFGAGSKVFSSNRRKVSKITKHVGISKKRAKLLFKIVRYFQPNSILEVGTSLGISTSVLSLAGTNSRITTLEGCMETANVAKKMFDKYGFKNVDLKVGEFQDTLPEVLNNNTYDFIYLDGNHTKKATLKYFNLCLSSIHNDSILIFDDIHWSKEMEGAWEEIKENPKVTVTIDTYQWGIVFFRKEQEKEHFTIRV